LGELSSLDDFKTETPFVREQMKKIYEFWIEQAGFDGFRIDTVKHVEMGFWQEWCPDVREFAAAHGQTNFFMFGEVPTRSDAKIGSYTGTKGGGAYKLDSVLDYSLYFAVPSVFATADGSPRKIAEHYRALALDYDPTVQNQLVTFLDNHDQPRFLSEPGATTDRLKVALVFLYTAQGIPCLYAGTEQAFNGAKDPWDREDMFAGQFEWGPSLGDNFNQTHPLFQLVAQLNNFRRLYPALSTGKQQILWSNAKGPGLFAFTRHLGSQTVLVVFNTAGTPQTLPGCPTAFAAGTKLVNLFDTKENGIVGDHGRTPPLVVPATSAKIFTAESEVQPLDPVVTTISPAHDAKAIPTTSSIKIHFSEPMDTASVEKAFSTTPVVDGNFSWSPAGDELTFAPAIPVLLPRALVVVHIGDTARGAKSGKKFYAAFESRYFTGAAGPALQAP
jgi:hypothetical protein